VPAPSIARQQQRRPAGFIEYEYSIGDPMLSVDLILPEAAYEIFCRANRVRDLPAHPVHPDDTRTQA
jgi:phenol hydroxylase P0 protein